METNNKENFNVNVIGRGRKQSNPRRLPPKERMVPIKRHHDMLCGRKVYYKFYPFYQVPSYVHISENICKYSSRNKTSDPDTESDYPYFEVVHEVSKLLHVRFTYSCRGWGVFACSTIEKGICLGEYVGEIQPLRKCRLSNYKLKLENGYYIDAKDYGNELRFINSSCFPNAVFSQIAIEGILHVFVISTRRLEMDEEIFCSYYDNCDNIICDCLSPCTPKKHDDSQCLFVEKALPNFVLSGRVKFVPNYYYVKDV